MNSEGFGAAEKKAHPSPAPKPAAAPAAQRDATINDTNVQAFYKSGEDLLKKGRPDEALKVFRTVYDYTRDTLTVMQVVKAGYEKLNTETGISQNQSEDLYLKLQRIATLTARYTTIKGESAYNVGAILAKKGDADQARKYLIEACQILPPSMNPNSSWMKAKNTLLALLHLDGEF